MHWEPHGFRARVQHGVRPGEMALGSMMLLVALGCTGWLANPTWVWVPLGIGTALALWFSVFPVRSPIVVVRRDTVSVGGRGAPVRIGRLSRITERHGCLLVFGTDGACVVVPMARNSPWARSWMAQQLRRALRGPDAEAADEGEDRRRALGLMKRAMIRGDGQR